MSYFRLHVVFVCICVSIEVTAAESSVESNEPLGKFLFRMEEEAADKFVEHCGAAVPSLKESLDAEYLAFKEKFRMATSGFMEDRLAQPGYVKPVSADVAAAFARSGERTLAEIRKQEPQAYCLWLRSNLQNRTEESIRERVSESFLRYEALQLDASARAPSVWKVNSLGERGAPQAVKTGGPRVSAVSASCLSNREMTFMDHLVTGVRDGPVKVKLTAGELSAEFDAKMSSKNLLLGSTLLFHVPADHPILINPPAGADIVLSVGKFVHHWGKDADPVIATVSAVCAAKE
jgi:hypothetical protein